MHASSTQFAAPGLGVHCFTTAQILTGNCFCIVMLHLLAVLWNESYMLLMFKITACAAQKRCLFTVRNAVWHSAALSPVTVLAKPWGTSCRHTWPALHVCLWKRFISAKGEGISGVQIELLSSSLYFVAITACVGQALRNGWEQQPGLSCSWSANGIFGQWQWTEPREYVKYKNQSHDVA